jgi:diadenosine tetraphosphatase ApaH/serine/threonine PP2A family protein phosphatase
MRIAVISDIHANREALDAVLSSLPQVDEVWCLGDIVGYGADPLYCLDVARESGWVMLKGNHDEAVVNPAVLSWFNSAARRAAIWTAKQLDISRIAFLRSLPAKRLYKGYLLVHGSPRDPLYEYILDSATAGIVIRSIVDMICWHGHTHVPGMFELTASGIRHFYALGEFAVANAMLVNPGSVGQPRDGDPRASFAIFDTETRVVEFRRVEYDIEKAANKIAKAGLPTFLAQRLFSGI